MSRYIDAEAFIKRLENEADRSSDIINLLILNGIANIVRDKNIAPTADVIEIPNGLIGDLSDGYHTFNELYHHRAILFSVICNSMPDKAWKSKLHDTGDMFDGMFIVGIETPEGQATYHYDIEPYWDMFKVKELEKAPKWDGHTPQVAIDRISKLSADVVEVVRCKDCKYSEIDENGNLWCAFYNGKIREMPNGYCWHGERKEE
jgi:hypothetical protein